MADKTEEERRRQEELKQKLAALAVRDGETDESDLTRTEARIDQILAMMVDGQWVTGKTSRGLATLWNMSTSRVENYAAEASRIIRRYYRDDPEARKDLLARHCQTMERLAQKAEANGPKTYREAIEANKVLAQLQGVLKVQLVADVTDSRLQFFAGWTSEEKLHFAETGERPARFTKEDGGAG
jgi:hypothetical protein